MKLALNGATIMRSTLERDIEVAAACGYDALEIWAGKLGPFRVAHPDADLGTLLRSARILPWCINSIEDITSLEPAIRQRNARTAALLATVARESGAPAIVVVPARGPEYCDRAACVDEAVRALRELAAIIGDIQLGFEFLGKPQCHVPTLDMAIEILARVDRENVRLVIDTFHFYAGDSKLEDIARVPVERLLVVHLNGCEGLPKAQLTDGHRLYPGEGAIPIDEILSALRGIGYDGTFSVEIFREQYWAQDAMTVARTAKEKADLVLKRAGFAVPA
jgi:2-keto-myo-inositol isomerase